MFTLHIDTSRTWRGGQNQVLLTVLGLRKRGHRTALVMRSDSELAQRSPDHADNFLIDSKMESDIQAGWRLSKLLQSLRPNIVHAHDAHAISMALIARLLTPKDNPLPVLASRRVDFHVGHNIFSRWKYAQVDHFLCASQAISNMLIEDGIHAEKTTVVHEGIDLIRIDNAPFLDLHEEFSLPVDCPVIGNIAALVPHKGQDCLIDAASQVSKEVPEARFLIVGTGELHETLRRKIHSLNLEQQVILTGFRNDVLSILRSLDLFVMSSLTEGLGTSVLDAMAARRAVVATRAGGIPESVVDEETGLLTPVGDANSLSRAIVALLKDPNRRHTFGQAGRQRAQQLFSDDRMVERTTDVYANQVDTTHATDKAHHHAT